MLAAETKPALDFNQVAVLCRKISRSDPYWTTGGCLTFALALHAGLKAAGIPAQILAGYWIVERSEGGAKQVQLSHVVVEALETTFDSTGAYAADRWDAKFDFPFNLNGDEVIESFGKLASKTGLELVNKVSIPPSQDVFVPLRETMIREFGVARA